MNSIYLIAIGDSIKYSMFKDVYYLLKNNQSDISLKNLYDISFEYQIIPYVFYVLYYTFKVFNDKILEVYINAFRTEQGDELLNCYGLTEKERKVWNIDFTTRLEKENIYEYIKNDLTEEDLEKIKINSQLF